jgi:heme-degrading monooxygenase HmoA
MRGMETPKPRPTGEPCALTAGQVVTVFRSRLRAGDLGAYAEHAARMATLAAGMPGYVEHKGFAAPDGERVTLVTFADRPSHDAWRDHPEHRAAQTAGIAEYYAEYTVQVAVVDRVSRWTRGETARVGRGTAEDRATDSRSQIS